MNDFAGKASQLDAAHGERCASDKVVARKELERSAVSPLSFREFVRRLLALVHSHRKPL